jgi:hypothetical protein
MRLTYSSTGGGGSTSAYALTESDLEEIIAQHFGYDPGTVNISGLEIRHVEFHVSGRNDPVSVKDDEADVQPHRPR